MTMRLLAAAFSLSLLAACAGTDSVSNRLPPGFVSNAAEIVANTDWAAPEEVRVTIADHAFKPSDLVFHRDRATRLVLVNATDSDHGLRARSFFADIAVESVRGGGQTTKGPWIEYLSIPAGETKELWFVPARFGAYSFECNGVGHPSLGERGVIDVVR
ncbi:Copper tolerance protein [Paramagnetospirillum magnetotacticum MS-1]|uniref:Copper tolerance protein n=1 Tax=Paramagnetospirillum magnetotacticum MS-1 TaxID=272627 RepID=A0A0C2YHK3_PARME|nr:multicopper oxidase [Paramagnetospirillum magnetotacticum]KIL99194.1 Copper tolerance protein [Paramagnetospirillum magnetotacticum MS-1]